MIAPICARPRYRHVHGSRVARVGITKQDLTRQIHALNAEGIGDGRIWSDKAGATVRREGGPIRIDTFDTTGTGEIAVLMLALFARMDRGFTRQRAAHARSVAAKTGRLPGRPRRMTHDQVRRAAAALNRADGPSPITRALDTGDHADKHPDPEDPGKAARGGRPTAPGSFADQQQ